jgi:hypothetical protein
MGFMCTKCSKVNMEISIRRLGRNKIQSSNKAWKYVDWHPTILLPYKQLVLENYLENFKKHFLLIIENA